MIGTVTQALAKRRMGRTGILTASAAIVFWPAAPAFLLMKGKDVTLHKGMAFEVFTDSDFKMSPPAAAPVVSAAPAPAVAAGPATVHITSDVPGADVEVDALFIGKHKTWERTLSAQAGDTMNVAATLKQAAR